MSVRDLLVVKLDVVCQVPLPQQPTNHRVNDSCDGIVVARADLPLWTGLTSPTMLLIPPDAQTLRGGGMTQQNDQNKAACEGISFPAQLTHRPNNSGPDAAFLSSLATRRLSMRLCSL